MKKKIVSLLLVVLMLLTAMVTALPAFAETAATYNVVASTDGTTMTVTLTLATAKAAGGNFTLQYNKDNLTFSKTEGTVIGSFNPNYSENSVRLSFSAPVAYAADTQIIKIMFTVNNGKTSKSDITMPAYKLYSEESVNIGDQDKSAANITFSCTHANTREQIVTEPAHTEAGEKAIVCSVCDATIKTEVIPATNHSFGEWVVTKAPTCIAEGEETRNCSCGEKENRAVAMTAHTAGEWEVTKAPTCTEKGEEIQKCTVCASVIATRETLAKGHAPAEFVVTKSATCTEAGSKSATCTACGEKFTEVIPALGHSADKWETVKEPTCTEAGLKEGICSVCGEKAAEVIPALGHSFGEWTVVKEATETDDGSKERICSVCGEKETEIIPKLIPAETTTVPVTENKDTPEIPKTNGSRIIGLSAFATLTLALSLGGYVAITRKPRKS